MANRLAEYERPHSPNVGWGPAQQAQSQDVQQRISGMVNQASQWIMEHPEIALASAVVTGVVLGWLIKRR